ncbi:MAG TPA: porin [Pelagibacterium sp.]|uniref:porin n=1 Tax=Pelagibacterium sp. TaxID=1967288 RepID=UPI002BCCB7DF|nr:porin [Pelagibacterium sp.]HWJ87393.1 porin [Pelagibacterium sp.]
MKLKSLLLGSAAALALSTGAQAADPIANFVSLGVCDAYGISGLTIESDDTCLKISGKVDYEYRVTNWDTLGTFYDNGHGVEWQLLFEATTQTDAGAAKAVLRLNDVPGTNGEDVRIERAFVSFGDTTVLTAGRIGSLFSTTILDQKYGSRHEDFIDFWNFDNNDIGKGYSILNTVRTGGMGIQIESLIADGFSVLVALEDLAVDGTFGLGVAYDANGISAEAGILFGDLYDNVAGDPINFYLNASADFDNFTVRGGFIADDAGAWVASIGADATFDMFSLKADALFDEPGNWTIAGEGSFAATDTVDIFVGAAFTEFAGGTDTWTIYGGAEFGLTENISARAQVGYIENARSTDAVVPAVPPLPATRLALGDVVYGEIGLSYAPGGGFKSSLDLTATDRGDYQVTFSAEKSF